MKYADSRPDGRIAGFYDEAIHGAKSSPASKIPAGAVAITDEEWRAAAAAHEAFRVVRGALVAAPPPDAAERGRRLVLLKAAALRRVDGSAESARLAFITPGSGQALVYEAKRREAADCLAKHTAPSPPAAGAYPFLDAEVGITKSAGGADTADAYQVAVVIDAMATAWTAAGAAIEAVRLGAKRDIAAAATQAAIDAVLAGLVWPKP